MKKGRRPPVLEVGAEKAALAGLQISAPIIPPVQDKHYTPGPVMRVGS